MIYSIIRVVSKPYFHIAHGLTITGHDNIPTSGPVILCANHSSWFDSILLGLCSPRQVRFLVDHAFYRHPFLGFVIKACKGIPISQRMDKEAISAAMKALRSHSVLGIFPEGRLTNDGRLKPAKTGAAWLAAAAEAPIVPVSISGAFCVFPKGKLLPGRGNISVHVHPPVKVDPDGKRDKEYLRVITENVMARIGGGVG